MDILHRAPYLWIWWTSKHVLERYKRAVDVYGHSLTFRNVHDNVKIYIYIFFELFSSYKCYIFTLIMRLSLFVVTFSCWTVCSSKSSCSSPSVPSLLNRILEIAVHLCLTFGHFCVVSWHFLVKTYWTTPKHHNELLN